MTIKETIRWIQSWGWNRSFIGLISWSEEEEEVLVDLHWVRNKQKWSTVKHGSM